MTEPPQPALLLAIQGAPGEGYPPENVTLVRMLLEKGASPNATDENGFTALMGASVDGQLTTAKLLLEYGADLSPKDHGATISMTDQRRTYSVFIAGRTALQYAFEMNTDTAMMRLLLEHGADINVRDGYGCTLLISAASEYRVDKVRFLISRKADLHVRDEWGRTALMQANRFDDIVKLLKQTGATE